MKVLIFDPAADVVETISLAVQFRWPDAEISVRKHGEAIEQFFQGGSGDPDIIILELASLGINGLDVLTTVRSFSDVPVIFLSEEKSEAIEAKCLEKGADDYIRKPLNPLVLLARMQVALRRAGYQIIARDGEIRRFNEITVDTQTMRIFRNNEEVQLTELEWRVLRYMMRNPSKIISHEVFSEKIWGGEATRQAIANVIQRLRIKLGDDRQAPKILCSHRNRGYSFEFPPK